VYAAPADGTAGAVAESMNGIRKILRDGVSAGRVNDLAFGNFTTGNIVERIESIADSLPAVFDTVPVTFHVSPYWKTAYQRDKRGQFGGNVDYNAESVTIDFKPNMKIKGDPSMADTNDLWLSPDFNFVHVKKIAGMSPIQLQTFDRQVKFLTDWNEGVGFLVEELVYFHDSAEASGT
jgi:hypothetical protein